MLAWDSKFSGGIGECRSEFVAESQNNSIVRQNELSPAYNPSK